MRIATKFRGLVFCGLLTATPLLMTPPQACAAGIIETETFYSDASFTIRVGRCIQNTCTGTFTCSGIPTQYSVVTVRAC